MHLGESGSALRIEWLMELARRVARQFVARKIPDGGKGAESWLVKDPRALLRPLEPTPEAQIQALANMGTRETPCCVDVSLARKD